MKEIIAQVGEEPPLEAVVMEGLVLLVFLYLAVRTGLRYMDRKSAAVKNLFLSFFSYLLAGIALFTTKLIEHSGGGDPDVSSLGINLGYAFSALGNLFLFYFTLHIFIKEEYPYIREIMALATGITEGFLIIFIFTTESPFYEVPGVYLPFQLLIWHVGVSSLIFSVLFYKAMAEWNKSPNPIARGGFFMIAMSAIFELLVFVFFFIDSFYPDGYSLFYFLGWISASIAGLFAMIGYLMPDWFKTLITRNQEK